MTRMRFLVSFFKDKQRKHYSVFMSQDLRNEQRRDRDISRTATEGTERKFGDGFEGMNYEQIRQPYNPKHKGRNSSNDQRNDSKRPDEG